MLRIPTALQVGCSLLFLVHVVPADARVLTLTKQTDTTAIVQDAADGDAAANALVSPQDRLFVEGGLAADVDHDLVYVASLPDPAGGAAGTPHVLLVGAYGSAPVPSGSMTAPAGLYFSALVFDPASSSVLGLLSDPGEALPTQAFAVATNAGTLFGTPIYAATAAGCCRLTRGVAAWRAATGELFAVGRRAGDSEDQLLRFDFAGSALPDAYPVADDRIVALAVDAADGSLYALARSALDFTYLTRITYTTPGTPVTLSAIGSAPATCCYVAAGPAAIDGAGSARALYALTRDATAPTAMQLSRFDFSSGNPVIVNAAIEGYGLWTDAAASLDRIFADGFD
jgi:hypothetical protein